MRYAIPALLCATLAGSCGTTRDKSEAQPPAVKESTEARAKLVSGRVPAAPAVKPELVVEVARARLPDGVQQKGVDEIVGHLRAGRSAHAEAAWRKFAADHEDADQVAHWVVRQGILATRPDVMDAALAAVRHDEKRLALKDGATLAREIAATLGDGHTIRYERLDPESMKRLEPVRMAPEELEIYGEQLETALERLEEKTPKLEQDLRRAIQGRQQAMQRMANVLKQFADIAKAE